LISIRAVEKDPGYPNKKRGPDFLKSKPPGSRGPALKESQAMGGLGAGESSHSRVIAL